MSYLSWVIVWRRKDLKRYALRLLRQMLEIYSPSGSEAPLATFLSREMAANGFATRLDHAGNVLARIGQAGPRILLCGHLDTVPGETPVRVKGGAIYGRGAVDAKSSLGAMIIGSALGSRLSTSPVQVDVAGVVEEEAQRVRGAREVGAQLSAGCITRVIAAAIWSHLERSTTSRFRPAAVSR